MNEERFVEMDKKIGKSNYHLEKKYTFRRTYFILNDATFVELIGLMQEVTQNDGKNLEKYNDTIATESKERLLSAVDESFAQKLINEEIIHEIIELNELQFNHLKSYYKDDLFSITKKIVDNIN